MQGPATPGGTRSSARAPFRHTAAPRRQPAGEARATAKVGLPLADAWPRAQAAAFTLTGLRVWLLVAAVACAYLLPGILGHDPWKQDETYTFGIIQHMLDTGDLVVPSNAGQPFLEKPPLYDWTAAALAWLFGRYLPLHDAARLASALFAALAFGFTARAARIASGARRWLDLDVIGPVALCAGTLVVVKHVHDMMTDVALMAGAAIAFSSLLELVTARCGGRPAGRFAAVGFGAGVGIALMAKGLFVPLVFGATLAALLVLYPACRSRAFFRSLGVAALVFAPFALIWPIALLLRSETLFMTWFWDNNVGRFFGFSVPQLGAENDKPLFIWRALLTVGFPVGPLAIWALAAGRWRAWRVPAVALPALFAGIGMIVLQVSATSRELYILPFIAPLALLAATAVARLPMRVALGWDYLSRTVFGAAAGLVWYIWSIITSYQASREPIRWLGRWLPLDWTTPLELPFTLAALALTIGWLWTLPSLRATGKWRGALSWAAGVLLVWGLIFTLLLPWLDAAKSYRTVFASLNRQLERQWNEGDCMASLGLGESEAPMLYYFAGIQHRPVANPADTACTWLIVQGLRAVTPNLGSEWQPVWSGARPGDNEELLRVYVRTPEGGKRR
ncbi:ArnT family glycosyltransferase [Burkholderia plantarii]|uniref:ArnT family glycosyltransferase n=1 Tax=Burkholderia plantarii TaxID=41899 RepID=UPI0018DC962D|nr:glycosyl transferase [Burkholderia plantarii]MBI0327761.1 glycosyl transferase [Burkholderia plantarii]